MQNYLQLLSKTNPLTLENKNKHPLNHNKNSLTFINYVRSHINGLTDNVYEDLVDQDYDSLDKNINDLVGTLKELQLSYQDEL